MSEWTHLIDDVINYTTLLKELGIRTVEFQTDVFAAWDAHVAKAGTGTHPAAGSATATSSHARTPAFEKFRLPEGLSTETSPAEVGVDASPEMRRAALSALAERIGVCTACPLHSAGRTKVVPGQGNACSPDIMFIGEAPGEEEDLQGLAFVGAAGQFLTKMITAMGYAREDVFIANVCKCRPPRNRVPDAIEMQKCLPFLREQIQIVRPKVIVLLGGTAIKGVLNNQVGVTRVQGQWTSYEGIPVMPTFHPSYILRFENSGDAEGMKTTKLQVWEALKRVLKHLGKPVPTPGSRQA